MPCFHPLEGWKWFDPEKGRVSVTLKMRQGFHDLPVALPCGGCDGCLLERARQWAIRCVHESEMHRENCFVTLTYADEHLPLRGSLDKSDFQKFMKRLRKEVGRVRFFHSGEYGDQFGRPHYHALLFGWMPSDRIYLGERKGLPVWRSPLLERLWPYGRSEVGTVTFDSACYVARYVLKKRGKPGEFGLLVDQETGEVFGKAEPYSTMSRRPGIGARWLEKFGREVAVHGSVVSRGREVKPPRYYDVAVELVYPELFEKVRQDRRKKRSRKDESPERLEVIEKVAQGRVNLYRRELES